MGVCIATMLGGVLGGIHIMGHVRGGAFGEANRISRSLLGMLKYVGVWSLDGHSLFIPTLCIDKIALK